MGRTALQPRCFARIDVPGGRRESEARHDKMLAPEGLACQVSGTSLLVLRMSLAARVSP